MYRAAKHLGLLFLYFSHDCLRITGALSSIRNEFSTTSIDLNRNGFLFSPKNVWALSLLTAHLAQSVFRCPFLPRFAYGETSRHPLEHFKLLKIIPTRTKSKFIHFLEAQSSLSEFNGSAFIVTLTNAGGGDRISCVQFAEHSTKAHTPAPATKQMTRKRSHLRQIYTKRKHTYIIITARAVWPLQITQT